MRNNKRIDKLGLCGFEVYDAGSIKGNPTDKSVLVTVLYKREGNTLNIGCSVKLPNDIHKARIGKAIALRHYEQNPVNMVLGKECFTREQEVSEIITMLCMVVPYVRNTEVRRRIEEIRNSVFFDLNS